MHCILFVFFFLFKIDVKRTNERFTSSTSFYFFPPFFSFWLVAPSVNVGDVGTRPRALTFEMSYTDGLCCVVRNGNGLEWTAFVGFSQTVIIPMKTTLIWTYNAYNGILMIRKLCFELVLSTAVAKLH